MLAGVAHPLSCPADVQWALRTFRYLGIQIYHNRRDLRPGGEHGGHIGMEELDSAKQIAHMGKEALGAGTSKGDRQVLQIECSPNRFQLLEDMEIMVVNEKQMGDRRPPQWASLDGFISEGLGREAQILETEKVDKGPRLEGDTEDMRRQIQDPRTRIPSPQIPIRAPSRDENGQQWDSVGEEIPNYPIAGMLSPIPGG
ncbi:hypothetical protein NDU88_007473 [Pleurodeles waltl]|uniref:Uncharacterized protein n=1 Tax=Pleurodeles waltl TaxID=8319 RepID=A0AAV7RV14_PLEWA|nr:hypothetical protein NDU88_007473 [Pleurodeles waltl]